MVNKTYLLNNYQITRLDELVISFTSVLGKYTDYAVTSGYIAILFGLVRPTLDVDIVYE